MGRIAATGRVFFKAGDVGLGHLHIDLLREQERDIDADALAGQVLDGRQALRRRRHLDHQILAVDFLPQPLGFRDGALGIQGEIGRDLEADEAVVPLEFVVDRAQHVGGVLDVLDRKLLEQLCDRPIAALQCLAKRGVVFIGRADCFLEDRRVGGDALDPVGVDQLLQIALGDEAAGEKVQPYGLAVRFEGFDRIHGFFSICCMAASSTFSGVKPNFVNRSLSGADEPKVCMPMIAPVGPA